MLLRNLLILSERLNWPYEYRRERRIALGHVYVEALLGDPRRRRVRPVRLLVDTGATYLSHPPSLAEELSLRVEGEAELTLADGRTVWQGWP